jgi:hypothetical protein
MTRCSSYAVIYLCGLNEVEQLPVWAPFTTETEIFTVYPGVAPLM